MINAKGSTAILCSAAIKSVRRTSMLDKARKSLSSWDIRPTWQTEQGLLPSRSTFLYLVT